MNCQSLNSPSGALYISDFNGQDSGNSYIIDNNSFTNNTGKNTGAIFLYSSYLSSDYNFKNNNFSSNHNN